jgi:L-threonylcarbamoyladenylate synthase
MSPTGSAAEILPTHTPELFGRAVECAAQALRRGAVVALPTETVYGLAANAFAATAVARIFEIKGRPQNNPVIVHVASLEMARRCVADFPALAEKLARAFWPGPLTIVLPRSKKIPDNVTAGGGTVGVRWPAHPFIQAVIRECDFPLAAPSANRSGEISPTTADHVLRSLGNKIERIVDGGASHIGIESTVLDLTATPPRLLRPGMIHEESLLAVTGSLTLGFGDSEEVLKSPGLLPRHYAPQAKLIVLDWSDETELAQRLAGLGLAPGQTHVIAHKKIPMNQKFGRIAVIPQDAEAFGRAIYAELHQCDELGAKWIVVEKLPDTSEWRAISDRLKRAGA